MARGHIAVALLPLLWACGQDTEFVGDDIGDTRIDKTPDSNPVLSGTTITPDAFDMDGEMSDSMCMRDPLVPVLDLAPSPGSVAVLHEGMVGPHCAQWQVRAVVQESIMTIDVVYDDVGGVTCDRGCGWHFDYELTGLAPGEWTVNAGRQSGTVTIP